MDCYAFKQLKPKDQINYIYHNCRLVDFNVVREQYQQYGVCLYHDGNIFMEVFFDGVRGDKISRIKTYSSVQQLSHWYERINLGSLLTQKEI